MRFPSPLERGRLVRRYKRFLADIELDSGHTITAHCANPGSMRTCVEEGGVVWVSRSGRPGRKLPFTWEIAELVDTKVYVNPARANDLVLEAIKRGKIEALRGYDLVKREVPYGPRSRIDFLLLGPGPHCYVEVKCATMGVGETQAAFPDSVTKRGTRHVQELTELRAAGARAVLLFCVARANATSVRPADEIDPNYGQAVRTAAAAGVEILAHRCVVSPDEVSLGEAIDVQLDAPTQSSLQATGIAAEGVRGRATA